MSSRLYLVDALFHIFRAYYALPRSMRSDQGQATNAVHGVVGILRSLWKTEPVGHLVAVFESMSGIFREEISPDYKAHRDPPPEDLLSQIPLVKEVCHRLGLCVREVDRYEADDVIGTLTRLAVQAGVGVTIVSNDKDLAQLLALDGDVELLRTGGSSKNSTMERIRRSDVPRVFGVEAFQIPSFLALRGDAVDNIAGLKGVGDKTAARWLAEAGTLEGLLANPDLVGPRWAPVVSSSEQGLRRDLDLATVRTDLPMVFCMDDYAPKPLDRLGEFFCSLSMARHQREVEGLVRPRATVDDLWAAPN